jgi:hypothetical protein
MAWQQLALGEVVLKLKAHSLMWHLLTCTENQRKNMTNAVLLS